MLSALKNFFVTFLIAAIVFGSVAYIATQFLTDTISSIFDAEASELDSILNPSNDTTAADTGPVTEPPETGTAVPDEEEITAESFNMLFIVTDYQPDIFNNYLPSDDTLAAWQADPDTYTTGILGDNYRRPRACAVLLLRADKERKEFVLTPLPAPMRIYTVSGYQSMANLYNLYGREYIVSTVEAMTGLSIDYYLLANITEVSSIVAEIGGYSLYFSKELYYNGQVATSVRPAPEDAEILPLLYGIGKNTVDGPGTVAILMNEDYSTGVTERCETLVSVFREMLSRMLEMSEADFTAFYDKIRENAWVDTNLSTKDLVSKIDLLYHFRDEKFTVKALNYPGRFVAATETSEAYFEPNTAAGLAQYKAYRPMLEENQPPAN